MPGSRSRRSSLIHRTWAYAAEACLRAPPCRDTERTSDRHEHHAAGTPWDGVPAVASTDGFFELKRGRDRDPIFD